MLHLYLFNNTKHGRRASKGLLCSIYVAIYNVSLNLRLNVQTHAQQGLKSPFWFDVVVCEQCGDAYIQELD